MKHKRRMDLTEGNVKDTLVKMMIPMIFGMLGLVVFNLVDSLYISNYSLTQMAAMAFTFPVVLIINSLILGIGVGTTSAVSRAKGKGKHHLIVRYASDSLVLGVSLAIVFIIIGLLTIKPLFTALGADSETLPYIEKYMRIWYFGVPFVVIPMIGNNTIRALGDTKTPSIVMAVAATVNIIVDPLLIFGLGPFPEMGIAGAALATVISRMTTFIAALYVLGKREKVLSFKKMKLAEVFPSWKDILYVGLPTGFTRMIIPLATAVITRLLSTYGKEIVGGYGIAFRIERLLLVVVIALGVVMGPFVGQNLGNKQFDRINKSRKFMERFSLIFSILFYGIIFFVARPLASLFVLYTGDIADKTTVINEITIYLRIVPLAYGFQGIYLATSTSLNAMRKPFKAAFIGFAQMFIIYVPLAYLGSYLFGYVGVFIALGFAYVLAGIISHFVFQKQIDHCKMLVASGGQLDC